MTDRQNLALDIAESSPTKKGSHAAPPPGPVRVYVELACSYLKGGGAPTITMDCGSIEELERLRTALLYHVVLPMTASFEVSVLPVVYSTTSA